jgi:signal transduction histidine kinase
MKIKLLVLALFFARILVAQDFDSQLKILKNKINNNVKDTAQVSNYLKIASLFSEQHIDSAIFYNQNALNLSKELNNKVLLAKSLGAIASNYNNKNNFEQAITKYLEAAQVYSELENTKKVAQIYNIVGYTYMHLYAEDKAIEYYLQSIAKYKSVADEDGLAVNYIDIGNLYYSEENYDYAKKYFFDALDIYSKNADSSGIATCYTNLANAISDEGKNGDGLDYYKKSIAIQEVLKDDYGIAVNYNNIGDCYIKLSDFDNARAYLNKALKIAEPLNETDLIAIIYLNIADIDIKLKNYANAIKNAKKSLELAKESKNLDIEVENLMILATAFEEIGNYTTALSYIKKYKNLNDSLLKNERAKKVSFFNTLHELEKSQYKIDELATQNEIANLKYQTEKKFIYFLIAVITIVGFLVILLINQQTSKKRAYKLLEFKNFQINAMNNQIQGQRDHLKQMNITKDKFFSIIAHDLKNPFNSIKGFTELLIENLNSYDDEKRMKFLKIIKDSTSKAHDLLNNLLIWANNQSGNIAFKPKEISLKPYVSDVISLLEIQAVNKDIIITNNIAENIQVYADENMLTTILRNLLSNAIKFTNERGFIIISGYHEDKWVTISIQDNGIGMSQEQIDTLFDLEHKQSAIGTANEQGSGLGLILCKDFIEKHNGKIYVNSEIGNGTTFTFTLPHCAGLN